MLTSNLPVFNVAEQLRRVENKIENRIDKAFIAKIHQRDTVCALLEQLC